MRVNESIERRCLKINNNIPLQDARMIAMKLTNGRLGECSADAVRNAYQFYSVRCPLTYKDFIDSGLKEGGVGGLCPSRTKDFFSQKATGLKVKIRPVCNVLRLKLILENAGKKNHPVIVVSKQHVYTIFPTKTEDETIYHRRYISGYPMEFVLTYDQKKQFGSDLFYCGNSNFPYECRGELIVPDPQFEGILAPVQFIYNRLAVKYVIEVFGIETSLYNLKAHPFRFKSLKKEYNKFSIERDKSFSQSYNRNSRIIKSMDRRPGFQRYAWNELLFIFKHPFLGQKYRKMFDANLPMVIENNANMAVKS